MAVRATILSKAVRGNRRFHRGTLDLGNPYTAGGAAFTPATFGLTKLDRLQIDTTGFEGTPAAATNCLLTIDRAASKIWGFSAFATELTAADHSTLVVTFEAQGT